MSHLVFFVQIDCNLSSALVINYKCIGIILEK